MHVTVQNCSVHHTVVQSMVLPPWQRITLKGCQHEVHVLCLPGYMAHLSEPWKGCAVQLLLGDGNSSIKGMQPNISKDYRISILSGSQCC